MFNRRAVPLHAGHAGNYQMARKVTRGAHQMGGGLTKTGGGATTTGAGR